MQKLLIAVHSKIFADTLECQLKNDFEIYTCSRGDDALQLLETLRPDALIISLSLSYITGLSVLQRTSYRPPAVLALTYLLSDAVTEAAASAGVGALLLLPCSLKYILSRFYRLL